MARDNIKFSYDGTIIWIATSRVKENVTNSITVINQPTISDTPNISSLINLNKVEDRFTLNGVITEGKLESTDTYTTALDKKSGFKTLMGKGNVISMSWDGTEHNVAVDKYEIDYTAKDDPNTTQTDSVVYDVQISVVVGSDLI